MTDVLFAYGTLMSSAQLSATGRCERARLAREARSLGPATRPGRLYDLGRYPGLVEADGAGPVHGEALQLVDPERTLRWLDVYEGIGTATPDRDDYRRVERSIWLASGQRVTAWVYLYQRDPAGLPEVPDGRWVVPAP